eukprot:4863385-Lingulodinium_polyedra.AAC.1
MSVWVYHCASFGARCATIHQIDATTARARRANARARNTQTQTHTPLARKFGARALCSRSCFARTRAMLQRAFQTYRRATL